MHKVPSLPTFWNHWSENLQTWVNYQKQYKSESAKITKAGRKNMREGRRGRPHRGCGPWARPLRVKASRLGPPTNGKREATWLTKLNTWYILLRRTFTDFKRVANILDIAFTLDLLRYILVQKWVMIKVFQAQSNWVFQAFMDYSVNFSVKHRGFISKRWPLQALALWQL